jgi:hypothetical protein
VQVLNWTFDDIENGIVLDKTRKYDGTLIGKLVVREGYNLKG